MTAIIDSIRAVVGEAGVLTGNDVLSRPEAWGHKESVQAFCIVRPATTEEVSAVLKICHAHDQTVVTHGGMTGLVKGGCSSASDLVISLERMRTIENVDRENRSMTVQAGAVLQQVQQVAEEHGLLFPLDLGARGSATIGGNISTNAGGNGVIRYGMAREQVLGLEAVLADGTVISSMNSVLKNNTGYDLKQLFIGSEGTLGIVTRAVLRLRPLPRSRNTALIALSGFSRVSKLLRSMEAELGGNLSAFEVLWNDFYRLIIGDGAKHGLPLAVDHPFYVLLESTGAHEENDRSSFEHALEQAFDQELIVDAVIAQNEQQREDLWAIRDDIEALLHHMHPSITFDVSLNIAQMDDYVIEVKQQLAEAFPQSKSVFFGHIGDGNIHPVLSVGSLNHDSVQRVEEIIYGCLRSRNGIISAEHGIGLEKKPYLHLCRSPQELALMKLLKQSLDPQNLLNRGKIFDLSAFETGVHAA
ncbi:MAG: FAD-binding oxidoreductase [Xanthomonadales bacterium]|nr:FAD-binding oxidoreductase [Xanthomonadales bacterium]